VFVRDAIKQVQPKDVPMPGSVAKRETKVAAGGEV
jgi:hypothetical protein